VILVAAHQLDLTAAVAATNFITASNASKEAFKTANLLKTLSVNTLIYGEHGTGRKTLAQYILPTATVLDASSFDELLLAISTSDEVIISNIENSPNLNTLLDCIQNSNTKVIATCTHCHDQDILDNIFTLKITLPPLTARLEDVDILIDLYLSEIQEILNNKVTIDKAGFKADLSQNSISLKRQIFIYALLENMDEDALMASIEHYLFPKLGTNDDYRKNLYLYEVPLIRAGLKKFKSQLQLADKLGLNRNTLRKKIADNSEYGL
jgi:transcriptional regulator with PAS, ATPase and Fis domain